jgi:hypothetical protein
MQGKAGKFFLVPVLSFGVSRINRKGFCPEVPGYSRATAFIFTCMQKTSEDCARLMRGSPLPPIQETAGQFLAFIQDTPENAPVRCEKPGGVAV